MARMLIAYYSRSGHTQHMAEAIADGAKSVEATDVDLKALAEINAKNLLDYDAIVLGSPCYYGTMSAELKALIDESVSVHGRLKGKVAGAFASSANIGGGNETTVLDILRALLIHGMVLAGSVKGDHYGPVAVGDVDSRCRAQCEDYGRMLAELTAKLHS